MTLATGTFLPSGTNSDLHYWRSSEYGSATGSLDVAYLPLEGTTAGQVYNAVTDSNISVGAGVQWLEANEHAVKERSLVFDPTNVAGVDLGNIVESGDFSVYTKAFPLYRINDTVICSKDSVFQLGINPSWQVYARLGLAEVSDSGHYLLRSQPMDIITTVEDTTLKLYINNTLVGSETGLRPTGDSNFYVGISGSKAFGGQIARFGVASSGLTETQRERFYDDRNNLTKFFNDTYVLAPTGTGGFSSGFSTGFDTVDGTFMQMSFNAGEGVYSTFGLANIDGSITDSIEFNLSHMSSGGTYSGGPIMIKSWIDYTGNDSPTMTFQLKNNSGRNTKDIDWTSGSVTISTGTQLISESGTFNGSETSYSYLDVNDHTLVMTVDFPSTSQQSGDLRIYSANIIMDYHT